MKNCPSCGSSKWIESPGGNYCETCGESVNNEPTNEPTNQKAKLITWRYSPGYRDIDLLCEIDGRQIWLSFGKQDTGTLRNVLDELLRTAGKNPIDKD